jgi:acyl dehydratase/CBS domain-containing protein
MLTPITVREIMQTPVETVAPATSVRDAARTLAERQIGSLVVCRDGKPTGIVTDVDLTELVSAGLDPEETPVERIMSEPLVSIDPGATIEAAAATIREHLVKRLPVVEDDEVIGIVTTTDLSNYIPHLARAKRSHAPDAGHGSRGIRADTAYELDEWEYEYYGDEGQINVGDRLTFSKRLDEEAVRAFAEATGDTNRLHLDAEFAAETRFGGRIVHGTLVAGLISAALARLPGLTIYLSQDLSFLGPVRLGDRVTAACAVVEDLGKDRFRLTTSVSNSDGEQVIDGEAVVVSDELPQ